MLCNNWWWGAGGGVFDAALSPIFFYGVVVVLVIYTESVFGLSEYGVQKPILWCISSERISAIFVLAYLLQVFPIIN